MCYMGTYVPLLFGQQKNVFRYSELFSVVIYLIEVTVSRFEFSHLELFLSQTIGNIFCICIRCAYVLHYW